MADLQRGVETCNLQTTAAGIYSSASPVHVRPFVKMAIHITGFYEITAYDSLNTYL
jgi:hypothetical protein